MSDIAVVLGGDDSWNGLVVQPDISSVADLKGKTVAVDAPNTAYAFQLYEMLRQKGLKKGDYEVKPSAARRQRLRGDEQGQDLSRPRCSTRRSRSGPRRPG